CGRPRRRAHGSGLSCGAPTWEAGLLDRSEAGSVEDTARHGQESPPARPRVEHLKQPLLQERSRSMSATMKDYVTLGRSGLRVSPLCLGTMTFGTEWGWGSTEDVARAVFDRYLEAGGNFLDTADMYTSGKSEEMIGKFVGERRLRDQVVIATKFTFNAQPGN